MPNLELIEKILKTTGENPEMIQKAKDRIMSTVNYLFSVYFIIYVEERVTSDEELEKFRNMVEKVGTEEIGVEKYQEWLEHNKEVDMEEFWQSFEKRVNDLENDVIKSLKTKLDPQQQKEVLDFAYEQEKQIEAANKDYEQILTKTFELLQKKQQS